jgi:hypothetical protein
MRVGSPLFQGLDSIDYFKVRNKIEHRIYTINRLKSLETFSNKKETFPLSLRLGGHTCIKYLYVYASFNSSNSEQGRT